MHDLKTIDDLKASPFNPRKISTKAAAGLQKSLEDFGDLSGVVWNKQTGNLVCGHQRVEQLRKLGAVLHKGVLRVGVDGPQFPVRVVDWPLAFEKAANVVANNPHIGGEFTDDLNELLKEVQCSIGEDAFGELNLSELELPPLEISMDTKPPATEESEGQEETSHVRMVQLFLNSETFPVFQSMVEKLREVYGTENLTDTVMRAVHEAFDASTG